MAQFIPYLPNIEAAAEHFMGIVYAMKRGQEERAAIVAKHGIVPIPGSWASQQALLNVLKEIHDTFGDMNLFLIGLSISKASPAAPGVTLEQVIHLIDKNYHKYHKMNGVPMLNEQTGETTEGVGHYELLHFDGQKREMVIRSSTPFPCKFEEGMFTGISKYLPADAQDNIRVKQDITKEKKSEGADSTTFIINW